MPQVQFSIHGGMALALRQPPLSYVSLHHHRLCQAFSKPYLFVHPKTPRFLSQCTASSIDASQLASSIFLPFLQDQDDEEEDEMEEEEEVEALEDPIASQEQDPAEDMQDPLVEFFKSRASVTDQDPKCQGKLSLQANHRSSWHLATHFDSIEETEIDLDAINIDVEQSVQKGSMIFDQRELPQGIVGEIVQIARNLPENLTLGEALGNYEARVGDKECLEVLRILGEEGLVVDSLYFFEWMRLQEPPRLTPRACTLLFPVLGRARMGDKLVVLFENLPSSKEFRDVHVYNAAISGLLYCRRYVMMVG